MVILIIKPDTLDSRAAKLHDAIRRTDMPRGRGYGKELECFFDGVDLENLLRKKSKVLELGCGYGNVLRHLQQRFGIEPHGIDLAFYGDWKDFLSSLTKFSNGIILKKGDMESLPYEDYQFDFVFGYKSLMYVPDKLKAIKEVHRVLKINGTAVLEVDAYTVEKFRHFPNAEEIIVASQNNGQISVRDIEIWDGKLGFYAQPIHTATRVIITKRDSRTLQFPELVDFRVSKSWQGISGVTSFYFQFTT